LAFVVGRSVTIDDVTDPGEVIHILPEVREPAGRYRNGMIITVDGKATTLVLGISDGRTGHVTVFTDDGGVSDIPPMPAWTPDGWDDVVIGLASSSLQRRNSQRANASDAARIAAADHGPFREFMARSGHRIGIQSWRVEGEQSFPGQRGARLETWNAITAVGPITYGRVAAAYKPDGTIVGLAAVETMLAMPDNTYFCVFAPDGHHQNLGTTTRDQDFPADAIRVLAPHLTPRPPERRTGPPPPAAPPRDVVPDPRPTPEPRPVPKPPEPPVVSEPRPTPEPRPMPKPPEQTVVTEPRPTPEPRPVPEPPVPQQAKPPVPQQAKPPEPQPAPKPPVVPEPPTNPHPTEPDTVVPQKTSTFDGLVLRHAARSDRGTVPSKNEDCVYAGARLLAIADGMGPRIGGEVASTVAIRALATLDLAQPEGDVSGLLHAAVLNGNSAIGAEVASRPELTGIATTLTAILFAGKHFGLAHLGDSRCYLLRGGQVTQITRDDSVVQLLIEHNQVTADQAANHPQQGQLTRSLTGRSIDPPVTTHEARAGDRYLLCTRGLSGPVGIERIYDSLRIRDVARSAERLVELALQAGGPDNVSVIVADVVDGAGG
jgi:serine/threonine protein phosphatase PrpC